MDLNPAQVVASDLLKALLLILNISLNSMNHSVVIQNGEHLEFTFLDPQDLVTSSIFFDFLGVQGFARCKLVHENAGTGACFVT